MHLVHLMQEVTPDWTATAEHLTVVSILFAAAWAFMTERVVPGTTHRRLLKQNTQLMNLAFRLQGLAKSATEVAITSGEDGDT